MRPLLGSLRLILLAVSRSLTPFLLRIRTAFGFGSLLANGLILDWQRMFGFDPSCPRVSYHRVVLCRLDCIVLDCAPWSWAYMPCSSASFHLLHGNSAAAGFLLRLCCVVFLRKSSPIPNFRAVPCIISDITRGIIFRSKPYVPADHSTCSRNSRRFSSPSMRKNYALSLFFDFHAIRLAGP